MRLGAPVGLPFVRVETSVYRSARAADSAFDERSGERSAFCAAQAVARTLGASKGVIVEPTEMRPERPGRLGDEASAWVTSTRVERDGVAIDLRLERVTLRVDRVITTLLVATSPSFPLAEAQRTRLLTGAVTQAVRALGAS